MRLSSNVDRFACGKPLNVVNRGIDDTPHRLLGIKGNVRRDYDAWMFDEVVVGERGSQLGFVRVR